MRWSHRSGGCTAEGPRWRRTTKSLGGKYYIHFSCYMFNREMSKNAFMCSFAPFQHKMRNFSPKPSLRSFSTKIIVQIFLLPAVAGKKNGWEMRGKREWGSNFNCRRRSVRTVHGLFLLLVWGGGGMRICSKGNTFFLSYRWRPRNASPAL